MASVYHDRMRRVLSANPDGLPLSRLASLIGANSYTRALEALDVMADAYIDRWVPYQGGFEPVVLLVSIPEDCPHPNGAPQRAGRVLLRRHLRENPSSSDVTAVDNVLEKECQ